MSAALVAACLWALAATVTALLPMRLQFPPGIVLLALAPVLLVWLAIVHGPLAVGLGLLAFLSMFRRPLVYFGRKLLTRRAP
ncbi:MAG: DUF2484 family protein [Paracoccaceae bacterium]